MSLPLVLLRAAGATLIGLFALVGSGQAQPAAKHTVVQPAQPSDTPDKIEVLEFFSYSCPHCAAMEPLVRDWSQNLSDNVIIRPVPVAFNRSMSDLQKLFYALESLGRTDLHPKVFDAIHKERQRLATADTIRDWIQKQGVDPAKFDSVFKSFGINTKVERANELAKNYDINSTPTLAIGGRYLVSPAMAGSYQGAIDEAKRLVDQLEKQ